MSTDFTILPIHCPKCAHDRARLFVSSFTVITVVCMQCHDSRAIEIASLPPDVRAQVANPQAVAVEAD